MRPGDRDEHDRAQWTNNEMITDDWQLRHEIAMRNPNQQEWALVQMIRCLGPLVADYRKDRVMRRDVAKILLGIRGMLVADWGPRLHKGTIDDMLVVCAEAMDFDLDREEWKS